MFWKRKAAVAKFKMFSGWRIAKSVEEMVSRWALKRVCKFFLKKKLGQFILGDIDLDQLDVQLTDGSIQLSDLALNVDYLNQKVCVFCLIEFCLRRPISGLFVFFLLVIYERH